MTVKNRQYKRIGDFDKTFGPPLDDIEGTEVFIHDYSVGSRSLTRDGETADRPFTTIEVSATADGPVKTYHCWSESVAEKLGAIPKEELPLLAVFEKVTTGSGRTVWDVS
jgi:hypothetical protein